MNGLSDNGFAILLSALDRNPTLTRLDVKPNPHRALIERNLGARLIARIQSNDPQFTKAEFIAETASREYFLPLCQALSTNTHLRSFEMNSPATLDASSLAPLLAALQCIPSLKELTMRRHDFNDECGSLVANALPQLPSLTGLSLPGNNFTEATVAHFAQAVQLHSGLGYLNLKGSKALDIRKNVELYSKLSKNSESARAAAAAVFEDSSPALASIVTSSPSSSSSTIAAPEPEATAVEVAHEREAASATAAADATAAAETLSLQQRLEMLERRMEQEAADRARAEEARNLEAARGKAEMEGLVLVSHSTAAARPHMILRLVPSPKP